MKKKIVKYHCCDGSFLTRRDITKLSFEAYAELLTKEYYYALELDKRTATPMGSDFPSLFYAKT